MEVLHKYQDSFFGKKEISAISEEDGLPIAKSLNDAYRVGFSEGVASIIKLQKI